MTPLLSIADLSDDVPYPPEFGAYVLDPTRGASDASNLLSDDASREIFEKDLEAQHSMLNTDATRNFFTAYETADMSTMENRFGFTTWQQVSLYRDYLDDLSDHFLMRNATYDIIALASLMDKNMNNTANYLVETLPFDVTTRVMSSMVAESGQTCADLWVASTAASPAPVD